MLAQHSAIEVKLRLSGLNVELENMTAELSACSVNLQEFDELKETLSKSGDEIKIDLSEAIGALANVRLELVKQKRIERVVKHDLENLKKRLDQQKSDIVSLRTSRLTETQSASHIRKRYDLHLQKLKQEFPIFIAPKNFNPQYLLTWKKFNREIRVSISVRLRVRLKLKLNFFSEF